MADRTIGKVAVKVIPDTSEFRRDLKTDLDAIEKSLRPLKLKVEFDGKRLRSEATRMRRIVQSALKPVELKVDLDGVIDEAALDGLARNRGVKIKPELDKAAYATALAAISRLSGARILSLKIDRFRNFIANLDTAAVQIAVLGTGMVGAGGAAIAMSGQLFALSASLASIGGAALALPGIFAGFAVGLGITIAALKDFNKQLPSIKRQLSQLQDIISAGFWAKFRKPMQELANSVFPVLRAEVGKTASELGAFFGNLATSIQNKLVPALAGMFTYLNTSISTAATGTDAYANIIAILGQTGAAYLPALAQWFVDITAKFNDWLSKADADGRLKGFIDRGIVALGALGTVIWQTILIFDGLAEAAARAGGATLLTLADGLTKIAEVVNAEPFQTRLTEVFRSAFEMMDNISTIAGPAVTEAFKSIGQILQQVLPVVGVILGTLLSGIATALADPELRGGIIAMFTGIQTAALALAPIWPVLATAIGLIAPVLGSVAAVLATVFATSLASVVPVLEVVLPILQSLVEILGGALIKALTIMEPIIAKVSTAFGDMMNNGGLQAIKDILDASAPVFEKVANILGNLIVKAIEKIKPLLPKIAKAWGLLMEVIEPLLPILEFLGGILIDTIGGALNGIINFITGFLEVLKGLSDFLVGVFTGDWDQAWEGIKKIGEGIWNMIKGAFEFFINFGILGVFKKGAALLKGLWDGLWGGIKKLVKGIWDGISKWFDDFWTGLKSAVSGGLEGIKKFFVDGWNSMIRIIKEVWEKISTGVSDGITTVGEFISGLPGKVMAWLGDMGKLLFSAGKDLLTGLWKGISSAIGWLKGKVMDWAGKLLPGWVKDILGIKSPSRVFAELGKFTIQGFVVGLESQYQGAERSLKGFAKDIAGTDMGSLEMGIDASLSRRVNGMVDSSSAIGGVTQSRTLNYYAAPNQSLSSEESLWAATARARSGW